MVLPRHGLTPVRTVKHIEVANRYGALVQVKIIHLAVLGCLYKVVICS